MNIEINNKFYPLEYNGETLDNIINCLGVKDFAKLGDYIQNNLLEFSYVVTFFAIKSGCKDPENLEFKSLSDFKKSIKKFKQLSPATKLFNEFIADFFETDTKETGVDSLGELKGVAVDTPETPLG